MRSILFTYLILSASINSAQFTEVKGKGKVGFKYGEEVIKKPKYDSLIIGDQTIITAYKKKKAYYIDKSGKVIHKGKKWLTSPFIDGTGILQNGKGQHAILMANGDFLMDYSVKIPPLKYGQLLYVQQYYFGGKLYNANQLLETKLDTVEQYGVWLISTTVTKEEVTITKSRRLLPDKKEKGYKYHRSYKLYNTHTGKLKLEQITAHETYANNLVVNPTDYPTAIYTLDGKNELENLEEYSIIDTNYFSALQNEKRGFYSSKDLSPIITGDFDLFILKPNAVYALGDTTTEFPELEIYDYSGNLIRSNLQFVGDLDEDRFVFAKDGLQYIGTEYGEQLSGFHHGFGSEKNGYRIVFGPYSYSYINDQTYAKISRDYPVIGRKKSTYGSSGRRKGIIRTIVQEIVNTTRRFFGKSPVNYYSSKNYDPNAINIVEAGSGFEQGYAIVCFYGLEADNVYDSLTLTEDFFSLRYNYIDTSGKLIDNNKYYECRPFKNGYAWVQDRTHYYLIDSKGKKKNKYKFNNVQKDDNGYFVVHYRNKYGLINPNYEMVLPCEHSIITFEDGNYIKTYFSEKTVLFELPIAK